MDNLKTDLQEIRTLVNSFSEIEKKIKSFFITKIQNIQPLEGVKKLTDNCYTVSSASIFDAPKKILSAEYYNNTCQQKVLIDIVNSTENIERLIEKFKFISKQKSYFITQGNARYLFSFNANTLNLINDILNELGEKE